MKNHLPQVGLVEEQIYGELYSSWQKDVGVKATPDSQKSYRDIAERCIKEREIKMQKERVAINMCITLSSMLQRAHVTRLDLYHNVIRDAGCETLAHYLKEDRCLLHLNLGGNDIGPTGINFLAMAIGSHPKLQTLILGSLSGDSHVNRIDSTSARVLIEKCHCCETLKHIDLSRNPLGQSSQEVFPAIQAFMSSSVALQVLKLADTYMSSESALCVVEGLVRSPSLSCLDISSNNLSSSVALAIGKVISDRSFKSTTSNLKSLDVGNNPLFAGDGVSAVFRSLATDRGLTMLKVDNCGVDDGPSIGSLCNALSTNTVLTHLDLKCSYMTDVGAVELAKVLLRPNTMTHLYLAQNRIKDEGACAIASMVESNRSLAYLDLNDTWISDRGLLAFGVALANNTTLHTLLMNNNHISDDGGTAFAALLERNKSLLHCGLKGNSIFHSTILHIDTITSKNRRVKSEEVPSKLRKEIIKLHYQMYRLE